MHFFPSRGIKDVGSGINFKRHGLKSILERAMRGEQLKVVVAHKDRLARFGADVIEFVLKQNGGELLVLNKVVHSPEQELTQDLLQSSTSSHAGCTDLKSTVTKSKKIRVYPKKSQRTEIKSWQAASRWFYNKAKELDEKSESNMAR